MLRVVEECLRFDGPSPLTVRILRENTRLGDHEIPKDAQVTALPASANRDPAAFPDPDRFDVARAPNEHLAFGCGAHFWSASLLRVLGRLPVRVKPA